MKVPGEEGWDLKARTRDFALRIIRLYATLPKTSEAQVIARQLLRSGTSVGAHYREATRARSAAEFVSKLDGGLMELEETLYWIELLEGARLAEPASLRPLQVECDELIAILMACARNAKREHKLTD
jgi:four helix bundle protein